ncbi:hypothetical protein HMPREF9075_00964 [Capnocytophaga sp. oral taxon 332 str. F0381]|nr:hypothetical protein HMPREF9075_00964 [Capnocytophaga sp. oral taxon 332 str. F0381]
MSRIGFTYSVAPARRLSFGASRTGFYSSLILRSSFAKPSLRVYKKINA